MKICTTLKLFPTLFCIVFFINTINCLSQPTLYGIKNSGQNYQFVSIDCSNDSITVLSQLNFNHFGMYFNACFDAGNQKYYYTSGQILIVIDASTGAIDDSINFSGIHPFYMNCIVYNPRDGRIYGIKHNIVSQANFFSYLNLTTRQVVDVAPLPTGIHSSNRARSFLDAEKQLYVIQSATLSGIDIATGQVVFHDSIPVSTNQSFDHIAYSCKTGNIYGLWNEPSIPEEYFGVIDTTAQVTFVNPSPLPVSFYKSYVSGSAIDNTTDIFYYSALQAKLYGIDIHTGIVVYSHDYGPGFDFLFLQPASSFTCPVLSIGRSDNELHDMLIYPNPVTGRSINITGIPENSAAECIVLDIAGKEIFRQQINSSPEILQVQLPELALGSYVVRVQGRNFSLSKGIIVE